MPYKEPPTDALDAGHTLARHTVALRLDDIQVEIAPPAGIAAGDRSTGERLGPLSAAVDRGGYQLVTGPNGAGKSALMSVIALERPAASGRLVLLGKEVRLSGKRSDRARLRRHLGLVFQSLYPLPGATVLETVLLPIALNPHAPDAGTQPGQAGERTIAAARELLHWVGLAGRDHDRADSLSGGESRCLALARSLIGRPQMLIADDPTRGLDERGAWRMMGLIEQLHRHGTTIILATNDPSILQASPHPRLELSARRRSLHPRTEFMASPTPSTGSGIGSGHWTGPGSRA
ncbi:ATP-binding cassette domain-containing protein [Fodinicurvata sp. EGI_FJ10296]|uniref:cell division ATP-binding protein FtsE n=1 Tax=Fodinicurvata sp. EGI_FJ10296 TaxID=3231908 RepID=UPI003453CF75